MDWGQVFDVTIYIFAGIGALLVVVITWFSIDEAIDNRSNRERTYVNPYPSKQDESVSYLDNEVRGQIRTEYSMSRGTRPTNEPTLKGRVDMIEKHLGIEVIVKPYEPAKVAVRKKK